MLFPSVALKVQEKQNLGVREAHVLRKAYRQFRSAFDHLLADIDNNEVRLLTITQTLHELEQNKLTSAEFMTRVCYAYRLLSVNECLGCQMRVEIAYRLSLATLFYRSQSVTSLLHFSPANAEFTYQLLETNDAFQVYAKWKDEQILVLQAA